MADPNPPVPTARDVLSQRDGTGTPLLLRWMEAVTKRVFPQKFLPNTPGVFLDGEGNFTPPAASAPVDAEYVVAASNSTLTAERVTTNSTSNTWNTGVAGQIAVERAALTGDVTASANSNATTIANDAVTNAKAADMAQGTIKLRAAGAGTGDPIDGTGAQATTILALPDVLRFVISGAPIGTGVAGFLSVPYTGTITTWRILSSDPAVTSGSIVVDIWKDTYANYPPTVADTITAAAKPTVTTTTKAESSTLTGWTTTVTAGDVLGFNVDSVTSFTQVTVELSITRA